ncbi:acyltransferase family-domain-containing protein [Rhypophila decipiens]|uniref:Acyltransferase family-domain-containing protein n=1 Tax=Rhypophila decipiens TaxID=261697 RepID=A0AAN7B1H0_9PEZI|nr:acyltransferase family-domain-containing protein [Rhypophila decipiens]
MSTLRDQDDIEADIGRRASSLGRRAMAVAKKAAATTTITTCSLCLALLPSWARAQLKPQTSRPPVKNFERAHHASSAYMDGLRGLVAVLVFVRHFTLPWQDHIDYGYGCQDKYYGVLRLPFLRLLYAGPLVPVFFILSGYVLSAKTIRHLHTMSISSPSGPTPTCSHDAVATLFISLSGSAFRRALRLFPPPIISTFLVMLLTHFGLFSFDYAVMPGRQPEHAEALSTFTAQLSHWASFVGDELINPWRWDVPRLVYGPHLWTIPISFKGSAVTFLTCLVIARVARPGVRLALLCAAIAYALSRGRWDMALFLAGILVCELDARRIPPRDTDHHHDHHPSETNEEKKPPTKHLLSTLVLLLTLLTALYLASFPRSNNGGQDCVPGYVTFCRITPNYRYWHALAAFLIVLSVSRSASLQRPLVSPLAKYLGRISFSMYLVHEPLLHIFGFYTVPFFWALTGMESGWSYQVGFGMGMMMTAFVLVWVADLFRAWVEVPCGKGAMWLEGVSRLLCRYNL